MVIQKLLCISSEVALDKIFSTNKKIFNMGHLTSSISIEFDIYKIPKESTLIYLFKKELKPLVKAQLE